MGLGLYSEGFARNVCPWIMGPKQTRNMEPFNSAEEFSPMMIFPQPPQLRRNSSSSRFDMCPAFEVPNLGSLCYIAFH